MNKTRITKTQKWYSLNPHYTLCMCMCAFYNACYRNQYQRVIRREVREFGLMTSSNGNIFRVTGHMCREFTGHRWIPRTKASDAELWCFLICAWINGSVNNREAGDLRRHRAHCNVTLTDRFIISSLPSLPHRYIYISILQRHQMPSS